MKKFYYLFLMVMLLALMGLFVLKKPNGQPWLKTSDFVQPVLNKSITVKNAIIEKITQWTSQKQADDSPDNLSDYLLDNSNETNEIYRWQDDKGIWHYADKAPNNQQSQLVIIEKTNTITLPKLDDIVKPKNDNAAKKVAAQQDKTNELPTSPTTSKAMSLMKDSNNVQQLMDNRTKQLDKALKEQLR